MIKGLQGMMKNLQCLIQGIRLFRNWPIRLIEFFSFYPYKKIRCVLRNGLIFNVRKNSSDVITIWECIGKRVYEKYFRVNLNDIVIDIGANVGAFSIYAANLAKKGKVYAFEPEEKNFKLLEENIGANNLSNIKIFKLGVAGRKKKTKLFISKMPTSHSIYIPSKASGKSLTTQFITLKQIFKENKINRCNFLKIDCEGAEYDILFNCPKEVLKKIEKIAMEFHDFDKKHNHLRLKQYLLKNAFRTIVSDEKPLERVGMLYAVRGD